MGRIVTAWQAGADVIKVFPASAMGAAAYLRSMKAPLPQVELIQPGFITEQARKYIEIVPAFQTQQS